MLKELNDLLPIDIRNPLNRNHTLNRGLVGWWLTIPGLIGGKFWYDLHDNTFPGILTNLITAGDGWRGANRGFGAFSIDGTINSYIQIPKFLINFSYFTVSAWIKTTTTGVIQQIINADGGAASTGTIRNWQFRISSSNVLEFIPFNLNSGNGDITGTTILTDGKWHHVLGLTNGVNAIIYVDGKQDGIASWTGILLQTTDNICLAGCTNSVANILTGQFDDVRIWNRPLNNSEILNVYINSLMGYPDVINRASILDKLQNYYFTLLVEQQKLPFILRLIGPS